MIRRTASVLLALATCVTVTACGQDRSGDAAPLTTTANPTTDPITTADPTPTTDPITTTATPTTATPTTATPTAAPTAAPASAATTNPAGALPPPDALRFTAPLVGGGDVDLAGYAGQPVLLWFWAPY
jgi:hypothetical protein